MYEAFDSFLKIDTWHTSHQLDGARFYRALHSIVKNNGFNPDEMAEYMRSKTGVQAGDEEYGFARAIRRYQKRAWAVKDYLEANGL